MAPRRRSASRNDAPDRKKVSTAATQALTRFPPEHQIELIPNAGARRFLTHLRQLIADGKDAADMNDAQLRNFALQVEWASSSFSVAIAMRWNTGGGTGDESCTAQCVREKEACLERECGPEGGYTWPCLCCVDCRLAYLACLAGCVVHGFHAGGYVYY